MRNTLLAVEGVTAGYGNAIVLRNLTFGVPEGGVVSIIGPNGHGKSTLLRTISGLIAPTSGEILFDQQPFVVSE